jgi:lysozyme family protein
MVDFVNDILKKTLVEEGTWSDDADDAGGATMMGITQDTLSSYRGYTVSVDEVRNLSRDEAISIYQSEYYTGPKINLLPDVLQGPVFDWGVNSGPGTAILHLQQLVDDAGVVAHINVDGGIGSFTLTAVKQTLAAMGDKTMVNAYEDSRQAFYQSIVDRNPSQAKFLAGWTNRANAFRI